MGRRRADPTVVLPGPDDTTGMPESPVQGHELWVEQEPWAKYVGSLAGVRIASALALRAKRKERGDYVPPQPWFPALVTTALLAAVLGGIWLVVALVRAVSA